MVEKLDLLQGTLDLMVLQTLATMGSLHGYGIARRIELVKLHIRCDPKSHARAARPADHRPLSVVRQVIVKCRIAFH